MTKKEIIDGLKFTVDMFLFDPGTGEKYTEPRNDMDKTTIDACKGAIELLEQTRWIPVSERLPEVGTEVIVTYEHEDGSKVDKTTFTKHGFLIAPVTAWMPMIKPYKAEREGEA